MFLDHFDQDIEGDIRNLKLGMEEGKWSNQSYNQTELRRIHYVKEKKALQKEEQYKIICEKQQLKEIIEEEEDNKNTKKRKLKTKGEDPIEQTVDDKKAKNFYKNKKK